MAQRILTALAALSLLLCIGIAAVWVWSYSHPTRVRFHGCDVWFDDDAVVVFSDDVDGPPTGRPDLMLLYPPALVITGIPIALWLLLIPSRKRQQRLKRGLCVECGYDLRASSERCPECGTPVPPQPQPVI